MVPPRVVLLLDRDDDLFRQMEMCHFPPWEWRHCPHWENASGTIGASPSAILLRLPEDDQDVDTHLRPLQKRFPGIPLMILLEGRHPHVALSQQSPGPLHLIYGGLDPRLVKRILSNLPEEVKEEEDDEILWGQSTAILDLRRTLGAFARSDQPVLLLGESGSGKDVASRYLYQAMKALRPSLGAYVPVNCGAIPEHLWETELFGSRAGAFTGAVNRPGKVDAARGGVLFLDEIADMPMEQQVKLNRLLEQGEMQVPGESKTCRAEVRIIAATNADLESQVGRGKFRKDLFYRLEALRVTVPPLREHKEDIPSYVQRFIHHINREQGFLIHGVTPRVTDRLREYHWPGNIRELLSLLRRLACLIQEGIIDEVILHENWSHGRRGACLETRWVY